MVGFFSRSGFFSLLSSTSIICFHGTLKFAVVCNPVTVDFSFFPWHLWWLFVNFS